MPCVERSETPPERGRAIAKRERNGAAPARGRLG